MTSRKLDTSPLTIGPNASLSVTAPLSEDYFYIPGQAAAVRFFDPGSMTDFLAMREILRGKQTRKWMEDVFQLTLSEYKEWSGTFDNTSFLYSIHDARVNTMEEFEYTRGFVYLYSERQELYRVQRMIKRSFIGPTEGKQHALEISFAARPMKNGNQSGSGLVSSSIRESCLQTRAFFKPEISSDLLIFAFVDQENEPSHRAMESAGFVKRGSMKYDHDSREETYVYTLDWALLEEKIAQKLPSSGI